MTIGHPLSRLPGAFLFLSHQQRQLLQHRRSISFEITALPKTRISKAKSDAERRLEKFWWKLTDGSFDYQYFWRNKITSAQYAELKNRLQECAYEQKNGFVKRYGRVVAFYVAEWYKREYNGNDGKDNALKNLRLNFVPEEVWKYSCLPESFLYQRKNKMYLFSLYVLGGLPINYLIHKQFDKIFKEIAATYRQKSSEESIDANVFINNYALQKPHALNGEAFTCTLITC